VGISDADYQRADLFNATSPLRCESVRRVLADVAAGGPAVIGVDLDTGSAGFECLRDLPADWPPIVWAEDAVFQPADRTFKNAPALAGRGAVRERDRTGLAEFPVDPDGAVRRYYRALPLEGGTRAATF